MSPTHAHLRRLLRARLAAGLALLIAATAAPASTHAAPARPAARVDDSAQLAEANGTGSGPEVTQDLPSIHWRHAMQHEADVLAFEPGERVTVPFRPRADDRWTIDGRAPRDLPAGHATGRQMRDASQGSIWANGEPGRSGIAPGHDKHGTTLDEAGLDETGLDETVDLPIVPIDATAEPASARGSTSTDDIALAAPIGPSGLRREVFGFLPYWELHDSSTVLDWSTLSTVAYFSVGCRSDGSLDKRTSSGSATTGWAGWTSSKMTSIITAAHQHQTRVVLTVSCFAWSSGGATTQAALLGSSTRRATLAKQIAAAIRDRGADGVNLDFEPIVSGYADEFTALVRKVRTELNNVAPGYQLTFDTLGSIGNQPIADATAAGGADAVFIMGYDYRTAGAAYAGSISPLTGPIYDLTDTVKAYKARISPSKIILGVPYYGRAWSTASDDLHARTLSPAKYGSSAEPLYADAADIAAANGRRWDSVEQAPWTAYRKQTCTSTYGCVTSWRQLYYDDATSLKRRYDLVNREDLRGVGIWALGYDGARSELRKALADKFLADRTAPIVGIQALASTQREEAFRVAWKSYDDSAIKGYDVDVSIDGAGWARWLTGTTALSAVYPGVDGKLYAFRVRGSDVHGNLSDWYASPSTASALTVPGDIEVGGFATVLADGLRMRSAPSTGASIMTTLDGGDALQVLAGPKTADGYTWFQVAGPIGQWRPVDQAQVGGWVAAYGNGVENAAPRRPPYATRVDAGITGLRLNGGGQRVLTPNGDGDHDRLRITWTNEVSMDDLRLRVFRLDGSVAGSVSLGGTGAGGHAFDWDGRIGGSLVPAGSYVVQLQGTKGSTTFHAPTASPVTAAQVAAYGVIVGSNPTAVRSFTSSPGSPTSASSLTFTLTFGGPVKWLKAGDVVRSGTATGCSLGSPSGGPTTWTYRVTGCSAGTVRLTLKADSVADAVSNWGPGTAASSPTVVIDRTKPTTSRPKVSFRAGVSLRSTSATSGVPVAVTWSGSDAGGAGVRDYDVRRSVDGGAWSRIATDIGATALAHSLVPGHTYRFSVRARDKAGNVGAWDDGPAMPVVLRQNDSPAITYKGTWRLGSSDGYSTRHVRFATASGASARYSFTGRAVAFVTTRRPDGGKVKVYLDGTYVTTIDTADSTTVFRRLAFAKRWSTAGTHTLRLVVVGGTAGHARVDLDAIAIMR